MNVLDLDIAHADLIVPGAIVGICLLLMLITWLVTRPRRTVIDVPESAEDVPPPTPVAPEQLRDWHIHHNGAVQAWIENHEAVLKRVSDQGLQVDLIHDDLTAGHQRMADRIRQSITSHPAPDMRAELSAMVVSSEATLHALKRSEYQDAERQHLTYIRYRDNWLQRIRQFSSADSTIRQLQTIPDETPTPDNFWADH